MQPLMNDLPESAEKRKSIEHLIRCATSEKMAAN